MSFSASIADGALEYGGGSRPALAGASAATCAARVSAHAARHSSVQPSRLRSPPGDARRRRDHIGEFLTRHGFGRGLARLVSAADGGRDLVGTGCAACWTTRRAASSASSPITVCSACTRPSCLAHRDRRWPAICRAAGGRVPAPDQAGHADHRRAPLARGAWRSATAGASAAAFDQVVLAVPCRPGLAMLEDATPGSSARSWAHSATSRTVPSCTATPR